MRILRTRLISVSALALALGALPLGAAQAGNDDGRPDKPSLSEPMNGQAAIDALGDALDEAAALNRMGTAKLRGILESDSTAWVDSRGRLFYKDLPVPANAPAGDPAGVAPYPLDQTFLLHSKPGSNRTIYIDVDGHTVSGTYWNTEEGVPAGAYPAWDPAGNGAAFNDAEKEEVQSVFVRVAEDYAAFDVDVTTQDPGDAAIFRTDAADQVYGTRALVSPSPTAEGAICGPSPSCGGVAYLDIFPEVGAESPKYQPAWVFPQSLGANALGGQGNTKNVAEATSHEVGHNFNLNHDGLTIGTNQGAPCATTALPVAYFCGQQMWAPIMGAGYYRPVTQWSRAEYTNADRTSEDDLAIIAVHAPFRADEAGATPATASTSLAGTKYISHRTDQDVYALGGCQGSLAAAANTAVYSPNLDIQLDLLNASGAVVASNNPASAQVSTDVASGMSAGLVASLAPGFYYLRVDGVGNGTPQTAYSDYGSLGGYTLSASGLSCGLNVPAAPKIGKAKSGKPGGKKTAKFKWSAPTSTGGVALTGYTVQIIKKGKVVKTVQVAAGKTAYKLKTKKNGKYKAVVMATNALGASSPSARSKAVRVK